MYFETTSRLLETIQPYIENSTVEITTETENKDWRNRSYKSDFVNIDAKNGVYFKVLDNEVIVFYFTAHSHFEDYSSEIEAGEDDYIERAKAFLKELFEYKIRHVEYYKGNALYSEKYFIMYHDNRDDEFIGGTWLGLEKFINPFAKKSVHSTTWQFDKTKGVFTTRQPKAIDPDAVEVIDVCDDLYIEIFNDNNVYTYGISEIDFDDYFGMYYWAPAVNVLPSGRYDTKDKAIEAAIVALKRRGDLFVD